MYESRHSDGGAFERVSFDGLATGNGNSSSSSHSYSDSNYYNSWSSSYYGCGCDYGCNYSGYTDDYYEYGSDSHSNASYNYSANWNWNIDGAKSYSLSNSVTGHCDYSCYYDNNYESYSSDSGCSCSYSCSCHCSSDDYYCDPTIDYNETVNYTGWSNKGGQANLPFNVRWSSFSGCIYDETSCGYGCGYGYGCGCGYGTYSYNGISLSASNFSVTMYDESYGDEHYESNDVWHRGRSSYGGGYLYSGSAPISHVPNIFVPSAPSANGNTSMPDVLVTYVGNPNFNNYAYINVEEIIARCYAPIPSLYLDADIDSDNNDGYNWPGNTEQEEKLEDDPAALGKLVLPAGEAERYTPIRLRLPANLDTNDPNLKIKLDFLSGILGTVNVFTTDKNDPNGIQVSNGQEYTLAQLNYSPDSGGITLYLAGYPEAFGYKTMEEVKAKGASPSQFITAKLIADNKTIAADTIKYLVASKDSFYYDLYTKPELRAAIAAGAIYNRDDVSKFGLVLLDDREMEKLGIPLTVRSSLLQADKDTGFNAGLYRDAITGKYILAFAGTDDWNDVGEDIWQGTIGVYSTQYTMAMNIAKELVRVKGFDAGNTTISGHSLGGGLASAASVVSGMKAITFNAAGLSFTTLLGNADSLAYQAYLKELSPFTSTLIDAYYADYDILSYVQDSSWIARNAIGKRIRLDAQYDADLGVVAPIMYYASLTGMSWKTFIKMLLTNGLTMAKAHSMSAIYYGLLVKEGYFGGITSDHYGYN